MLKLTGGKWRYLLTIKTYNVRLFLRESEKKRQTKNKILSDLKCSWTMWIFVYN